MEFIDGDVMGECWCTPDEECREDCLAPEILAQLHDLGVMDLCYGNIILRDGIYYVVDLAD